MVGAANNRRAADPWLLDGDGNRQQAIFIQQLRLLYQRSLRARGLAQGATAARTAIDAVEAPRNNQLQAQQRDMHVDMPRGWGPAAATTAATAAREAPDAASDDPCPLQSPPALVLNYEPNAAGWGPNTAATAPAAAGAAATTTTTNEWQQQQEEEDSDDEPPPGMMDTSGEEDEDEEDEDNTTMVDDFYTPVFRRPTYMAADRDEDAAAPATTAIRQAWHRAGRTAGAVARSGSDSQGQQQQQQELGIGLNKAVPLLLAQQCRQPAPCSFLRRGVVFEGCQRLLTQLRVGHSEEQWRVRVTIQDLDLATGYVAGSMQADNVPGMDVPIETFWEGCVIDDVNHTFFTREWGASKETDLQHWAKFEGFSDIRQSVVQHSGRCGELERHPVVYMRWKELFFVNSTQQACGLTIAGFYYIALNRMTGQLKGYYYDPHSSPFQELNMKVCQGSSSCSKRGNSSSGGSSSRSRRTAGGSSRRATQPAAAVGDAAEHSSSSSSSCPGGVSFASYSFA